MTILRAAACILSALTMPLADEADAATRQFRGTFAALADPGSTGAILELQGGTFHGIYTLPDGSLPGHPGTAVALTDFRVTTRAASGRRLFVFSPPQATGGLFFDFFANNRPEIFVFNDRAIQFQVNVPPGFAGTGPLVGDAIFTAGSGPLSRLEVAGGTAYVPVPPAALFLVTGLGALVALRRTGVGHARRHRGAAAWSGGGVPRSHDGRFLT